LLNDVSGEYSLRDGRELTSGSDKESLALCIERGLRWRDAIVGLAVISLDLGGPDLQHVLEVEGHLGRSIVWLWCNLLCAFWR
jgi:hypothetical protein